MGKMTHKSFLGWVGLSLVTAITLVGFAKPEAAYAARSRKKAAPKTMTVSGPIGFEGSDHQYLGNDGYEYGASLQYQLDNAVFKLDRTQSGNGLTVYTLASGKISAEENSALRIIRHDDEGNYLGTNDYLWTGDLPPQSLAPGSAKIEVLRDGTAYLTITLPGVSGTETMGNNSHPYQRAGMTIQANGTVTTHGRRMQGTLVNSLVDVDPFYDMWGIYGYQTGTLTVR
jgi:hypothetical protein